MSDLIWGAWVALFVAFEAHGLISKKQGDTLSERFRAWFHTNTRPGRAAFTVVWSGFAAWFLLHILTQSM